MGTAGSPVDCPFCYILILITLNKFYLLGDNKLAAFLHKSLFKKWIHWIFFVLFNDKTYTL